MSEDVSDDIKIVMKLERRLAELCQQSNRVRLSLLKRLVVLYKP